jgi:C4-dicarboxylate-binding protein DctP
MEVKKFVIGLMIASVSFCTFANQKKIIRWKINHRPAKYFLAAAKTFQQEVVKRSNGTVDVKIISPDGNTDTYDTGDTLTYITDGHAEMGQIYTSNISSNLGITEFEVFDLPFLFKNHKHVSKVVDGEIGDRLLSKIRNKGVRGLAFTYSGGFLVQVTHGKTVAKYEDMKGLTFRNFGGQTYKESLRNLGTYSTRLSLGDKKLTLPASVKAAKLDIYSSTYADLNRLLKKNLFKGEKLEINETNDRLLATSLVINEKFFNKLTASEKRAVVEAAKIAAVKERAHVVNDGAKTRAELVKRNIAIHELSQSEKLRWRKFSLPVYESFFKLNKNGKELVRGIENASSNELLVNL